MKSSDKVGQGEDRPAPQVPRVGSPDDEGQSLVSPAGGEGRRPRPRGGFSVDFRNLGVDEDRSVYDANNMTIIINKDHPVIAAALTNDGIESLSLRRLAYEVAFSEYAIALSYEMVNRDPAMPADDASTIFERHSDELQQRPLLCMHDKLPTTRGRTCAAIRSPSDHTAVAVFESGCDYAPLCDEASTWALRIAKAPTNFRRPAAVKDHPCLPPALNATNPSASSCNITWLKSGVTTVTACTD